MAVMYSSDCQRVSRPRRLPTRTWPATAATWSSAKCRARAATVPAPRTVSASNVTTISVRASASPRFSALALPRLGCLITRTRSQPIVRITSPVRSVEPSSTMSTRRSG